MHPETLAQRTLTAHELEQCLLMQNVLAERSQLHMIGTKLIEA